MNISSEQNSQSWVSSLYIQINAILIVINSMILGEDLFFNKHFLKRSEYWI